jgi:predicted metal-dependent hydrolase
MTLDDPRGVFKREVREWASKLDVQIRSLTIRPMATKWASCSSAGSFTFNDELLAAEEDVRRFVIVHELLHFSVPNHGKLWKSLMRAYLGDYEELERRLGSMSAHQGRRAESYRG